MKGVRRGSLHLHIDQFLGQNRRLHSAVCIYYHYLHLIYIIYDLDGLARDQTFYVSFFLALFSFWGLIDGPKYLIMYSIPKKAILSIMIRPKYAMLRIEIKTQIRDSTSRASCRKSTSSNTTDHHPHSSRPIIIIIVIIIIIIIDICASIIVVFPAD